MVSVLIVLIQFSTTTLQHIIILLISVTAVKTAEYLCMHVEARGLILLFHINLYNFLYHTT